MTPEPGAIEAALRAALARRDDRSPARFASPLVTAIVADLGSAPFETLVPLLLAVVTTLESVGVRRGRQFVLFVRADGARTAGDPRAWRQALEIPVLFHDPAEPTFSVRQGETPIDLDDELREAEAIVTMGPAEVEPGGVTGGPFLLCPGAAGARTVERWDLIRDLHGLEAAMGFSREVERLAPVDLAITWDATGEVTVAPGGERFAALARAAGWA